MLYPKNNATDPLLKRQRGGGRCWQLPGSSCQDGSGKLSWEGGSAGQKRGFGPPPVAEAAQQVSKEML